MRISNVNKLVVLCAAIGMGTTLAASNQQVVVQPSQGGAGGAGMVARPLEATVVKGQPYSAEIVNESVQTLGDGNKIVQRSTARVYRDAEGRVRREDDRPAGAVSISISDPVAGLSWTLNPAAKTARELPDMASQLAALRERINVVRPFNSEPTGAAGGVGRSGGGVGGGVAAGGGVGRSAGAGGARGGVGVAPAVPAGMVSRGGGAGGVGGSGGRITPRDETVVEDLPMKSIENLLCSGVRRTTTIAKGVIGNEQPIKIVSEEWTSVDLKVLVLTDLNDPRTGHSTYKLSSVRRGDPDPALFKVPSDYTVTRGGGGRGGRGN